MERSRFRHYTQRLFGIAANQNIFVAVGANGTIRTSGDGQFWGAENSTTSEFLYDVVWNGTQFVAVGSNGVVLNSHDGENWTGRNIGTSELLLGLAWNGRRLVAVGSSGTIMQSGEFIDAPRISQFAIQESGFEIGFTTTPGRNYRIERSSDLTLWTVLAEKTAGTNSAEELHVDNEVAAVQARFYRVVLLP